MMDSSLLSLCLLSSSVQASSTTPWNKCPNFINTICEHTNSPPAGRLGCRTSAQSRPPIRMPPSWRFEVLLNIRTTTVRSGASKPHPAEMVRDWSVWMFHTHTVTATHSAGGTRWGRLLEPRWVFCPAAGLSVSLMFASQGSRKSREKKKQQQTFKIKQGSTGAMKSTVYEKHISIVTGIVVSCWHQNP